MRKNAAQMSQELLAKIQERELKKEVRSLVEDQIESLYPKAPAERWTAVNKNLDVPYLNHFSTPMDAAEWIIGDVFKEEITLRREIRELESNSLVENLSFEKEKRRYKELTGADLDAPLPF